MTRVAVAALSARALAHSAQRSGFQVVALDVFGDVDTCAVAAQWLPIGETGAPGVPRISATRFMAGLRELVRQGQAQAWVAGSGFDGQPELLAEGAALLPLWGTAPAQVARVRHAPTFFKALATHGVPHPPVQFSALAHAHGWLLKDSGGCGGWQVRPAPAALHGAPLPPGHYLQAVAPGWPMSATFVANGQAAVVLGFNRQLTHAIGALPHVFCGVLGPVGLAPAVAHAVTAAVQALAAHFQLKGLCSLDFLLDGPSFQVLEINPRPPASMALYPAAFAAHVQACREGSLMPATDSAVNGQQVVFARQPGVLSAAAAACLQATPHCHDLPRAGTTFAAGEPVCSVSAHGAQAANVQHTLAQQCQAVLALLETPA